MKKISANHSYLLYMFLHSPLSGIDVPSDDKKNGKI